MASMPSNPTRPSFNDTEEDLLRFQEEFLAAGHNTATAATVVERRTTSGRDVIHVPLPDSTDDIPTGKLSPQAKKPRIQPDRDPAEVLEDYDRKHHVGSVLSGIRERDTSSIVASMPIAKTSVGFPKAMTVDCSTKSKARSPARSGKKKSLFAQQFDRQHGQPDEKHDAMEVSNSRSNHGQIITGAGLPAQTGSSQDEVKRIHDENASKIASMSREEILEEQQRLMNTLGPDMVNFIKMRQKGGPAAGPASSGHSTSNGATRNMVGERHVHFESTPDIQTMGSETAGKTLLSDGKSKDWLHMDVEEPEKTEWMSELPDDSAKLSALQKTCPARFDFRGNLLNPEENEAVPQHIGLHHHGENPELAGYSLSELFVLARSSMPQQQVMALETLAAIVRKGVAGEYACSLEADVVGRLLEAGLPFVLRWALDDSRVAVYCAALDGLHALLGNESDQEMSDLVATSVPCLGVEPLLVPESSDEKYDGADDEEKEEPTDDELIASDLAKGLLLRTNILPRLRYLLEVCSLPSTAVAYVFDVLLRFSDHSLQSCADMVKCPRLLDTVVTSFLPLSWSGQAPAGATYNYPLVAAVKLMNNICRSGRHLAAQLVGKYGLMSRIGRYLSVTANELALADSQGYELQAASWSLWQTLVLYGQNCDFFTSMQESILNHVQAAVSTLSSPTEPIQTVGEVAMSDASQTQCDSNPICRQPVAGMRHCSLKMFSLLEAAIHVAACHNSDLEAWQIEEKLLDESGPNGEPSLLGRTVEKSARREVWTKLSTGQVQAWFTLIAPCLTSALCAPGQAAQPNHDYVQLLSSLLSISSSYFSRLASSTMVAVDLIDEADLVFGRLLSWCQSASFELVCEEALSVLSYLRQEDILPANPCLPRRSCSTGLRTSSLAVSCLLLLCSTVRMMSSLQHAHKGLNEKIQIQFIQNPVIIKIAQVIVKHPLKPSHPLAGVERLTAYLLVKLSTSVMSGLSECPASLLLYHQLALQLVCRFKPGEEALVKDVISSIVLQPLYFRLSCGGIADGLAKLSLTSSSFRASNGDDLLKSLPAIRAIFLGLLGSQPGSQRSLWYSKVRHHPQPCLLPSILLPSHRSSLLPVDWMFLPLLEAFSMSSSPGQLHSESDDVPDRVCDAVSRCLQWLVLLETCQPHCMAQLSVSVKVARLLCVFLVGANLFLQTDIQSSLVSLLRLYTQPCHLPALRFDRPIPGLASLYDLYSSLVVQYDAVSYGNELFAQYLVLPMLRSCPVSHRRLIWQENDTVLQTISLTAAQSPVRMTCYLEPVEDDAMLLQLYLQALVRGIVRPQCSFLYCIAVHHVSSYMFAVREKSNPPVAVLRAMLALLVTQRNQAVFHHVTRYQSPNVNMELGFDCFPSAPADRLHCLAAEVKRSGLDSPVAMAVKQIHPNIYQLASEQA